MLIHETRMVKSTRTTPIRSRWEGQLKAPTLITSRSHPLLLHLLPISSVEAGICLKLCLGPSVYILLPQVSASPSSVPLTAITHLPTHLLPSTSSSILVSPSHQHVHLTQPSFLHPLFSSASLPLFLTASLYLYLSLHVSSCFLTPLLLL